MKYYVLLFLVLFGCKRRTTTENTFPNSSEIPSKLEMIDTFENGFPRYTIIHAGSANCEELHQEYYSNGVVKEFGCQGHYNSFGVSVGIWNYFDSLGNIIRTEEYFHDLDTGNVIIHEFDNGTLIRVMKIEFDAHWGEGDTLVNFNPVSLKND